MTSPSLADDEAKLTDYATVLADAIEHALPGWFDRCIGEHMPLTEWLSTPDGIAYRHHADQAATDTAAAVRSLLAADIDTQAIGPLEILRRATAFPTAVLAQQGVAPVQRDDFAQRNFPDDVYDLTPANFADVNEALHEPGLVWGAAKAHVHLRRRREVAAAAAPPMVVFCTDLMDRSKISAAFPNATFVRNLSALTDATTESTLALVDLRLVDEPSVLAAVAGRIIAFGSHVDEATLLAAEQAGSEALPRSVFFKRLTSGTLK